MRANFIFIPNVSKLLTYFTYNLLTYLPTDFHSLITSRPPTTSAGIPPHEFGRVPIPVSKPAERDVKYHIYW